MAARISKSDPFVLALRDALVVGRLCRPGEGLVVACSGGVDSVALLAGLAALGEHRLTVAHLDHSLRTESAADAEFVRELAERFGVPHDIERADVAATAETRGQGIEEAARAVRYEFLIRVATEARAGAVAVAHHADDNVETVLFRLFRGTGIRGLTGMRTSRPLTPPDARGRCVRLIRPLLNIRREEIEAFCSRAELPWREDATNAETLYRRNFLRHELLPAIRERINPKADEAILRLADQAVAAGQIVADRAKRLLRRATASRSPDEWRLEAPRLAAGDPLLRTEAIRLALEAIGAPQRELSADRLAEIDALLFLDGPDPTGAVALPGNYEARRKGATLALRRT